jgi:hypothetical protein
MRLSCCVNQQWKYTNALSLIGSVHISIDHSVDSHTGHGKVIYHKSIVRTNYGYTCIPGANLEGYVKKWPAVSP